MLSIPENSTRDLCCMLTSLCSAGATLSMYFVLVSYLYTYRCRFFPAVYYLTTSKIAIAVLGNLAFALALTLYNLTTKVDMLEQQVGGYLASYTN